MRLTEKNSKYAIVRTAFHGGGVIAYTNSSAVAQRVQRKNTQQQCDCGCCAIVTVKSLGNLPKYTGSNPYYTICV